jgi:hypothetical protein
MPGIRYKYAARRVPVKNILDKLGPLLTFRELWGVYVKPFWKLTREREKSAYGVAAVVDKLAAGAV